MPPYTWLFGCSSHQQTLPSFPLPSCLLLFGDFVRILLQLLPCLGRKPVLHKVDQCDVHIPSVCDEYARCATDRTVRLVRTLQLRKAADAEDMRARQPDGEERERRADRARVVGRIWNKGEDFSQRLQKGQRE